MAASHKCYDKALADGCALTDASGVGGPWTGVEQSDHSCKTTVVALRYESYPFSPVAMFSSGVTPRTADPVVNEGYVLLDKGGELRPVGLLLEGNPYFGRYQMDWDYKAGWAMFMYAFVQSQARDELLKGLAERGYQRVLRSRYVYDRRNGSLLSPKLQAPRP